MAQTTAGSRANNLWVSPDKRGGQRDLIFWDVGISYKIIPEHLQVEEYVLNQKTR